MYNNTGQDKSQELLLNKLAVKKSYNNKVIKFLLDQGDYERAERVKYCGCNVGVTTVDNFARFIKADFCRERLCQVCAWRRQSRFVAQTIPILSILNSKGYRFIMATLTIKNVCYEELENTIDILLRGYELLRHRRKIKRSWLGIIRSLELSYNSSDDTFHPHIHLLVCVPNTYFYNADMYISTEELSRLWGESIGADYNVICDIRTITEDTTGAVEVLKYSLKPSKAQKPLLAFYEILRGRRLISFSGIFTKIRKDLKYSDFDSVLTDNDLIPQGTSISYNLYRFDVTGGYYNFIERYNII